jgi:hypothetical protein
MVPSWNRSIRFSARHRRPVPVGRLGFAEFEPIRHPDVLDVPQGQLGASISSVIDFVVGTSAPAAGRSDQTLQHPRITKYTTRTATQIQRFLLGGSHSSVAAAKTARTVRSMHCRALPRNRCRCEPHAERDACFSLARADCCRPSTPLPSGWRQRNSHLRIASELLKPHAPVGLEPVNGGRDSLDTTGNHAVSLLVGRSWRLGRYRAGR